MLASLAVLCLAPSPSASSLPCKTSRSNSPSSPQPRPLKPKLPPNQAKSPANSLLPSTSWSRKASFGKKAAVKAGLTVRAMRKALQKPHVVKHLKQRRDVFRNSVCAANIHRLAKIRDAADNMPAVNAIKELERLGEDNRIGSGAWNDPARPDHHNREWRIADTACATHHQ
jgi:hypothetical protein